MCEVYHGIRATHCFLHGPSLKQGMALGKEEGGLYIVDKHGDSNKTSVISKFYTASANFLANVVTGHVGMLSDSQLWHYRLGHLPFQKIHCLKPLDCDKSDSVICSICPQARMHRSSFPHSQIHTTHIFQLIHVDTWGPYKYPTHDGF